MQYTTPTTETTYHSGNVYGSSGSASYSGSSTTYGSETTYVPYTYTLYWYSYKSSFYRSADLMKAKAPLTPVQPIGKTREKKRNGIVTGKEWHYFDE